MWPLTVCCARPTSAAPTAPAKMRVLLQIAVHCRALLFETQHSRPLLSLPQLRELVQIAEVKPAVLQANSGAPLLRLGISAQQAAGT